jgi:hypothetical protein
MPRTLLYIAALALLAFVLSQKLTTPKTRGPFVEACMSGGHATQRQCDCLADYVHDRLEEQEILAIMENRVVGTAFQERVADMIKTGSQQCR